MSEVILEMPTAGVALLRINRPEVLNALSLSVRALLAEHVVKLGADDGIHAIVITGDEKAFAAGADLRELQQRTVFDRQFEDSRVAWKALEECTKPIIAAVNGFALGGGCELALHCDIVIAGLGAKFGLPEVKVGIMPGASGTQRLLRAVGNYKAARYLLTGDFIDASLASAMGLVSEVVPDAEVVATAIALGAKIAQRAPLAVDAIKTVIKHGPDASLQTALLLERKCFQLLFASEDRNEGIAAMLEKREPNFKGR
jgi:enoyl-CoA hydratase/carnithine racemase